MKVNAMNAKIVASSSEAVLLGLLEGQPPKLVAELTRDLRIRQALRRTGPKASRAPFVVHRTAPDGGKSAWLSSDLIAKGTIRWNSGELAYVSRADDPATYSIPSDDDELSEVLEHLDVLAVRDKLQEHLILAETSSSDILIKRFPPAREVDEVRVVRWRLAAKGARRGDSRVITLSRADDGREIGLLHHRTGDDQCTIELTLPFPAGEPSGVVLMVDGRPIEPIVPFDKYGCGCLRYGDIKGVLDGRSELDLAPG